MRITYEVETITPKLVTAFNAYLSGKPIQVLRMADGQTTKLEGYGGAVLATHKQFRLA